MTSVASETVAYSSRSPQFQRSQASNQAQDSDSPFALMLEASAPPEADLAPRRPEPSEPTAPPQKADAPADPKKKTKTDAPDSKAADPSESAEDEPAAGDEVAVQVEAGSDTPVVEEVLPEIPETDDTAEDGSKSPEAEIAIGQVQAKTAQVQPAVTPEVAFAAPVAVTPEVAAPASGDGETAPDIAIKPTDAAGVPAAKSAPEAPVAAPAVDAPVLPVELQAKGTKDLPETKGKADLKPAELQAEATDQPVDADTEEVLPHQAKTDHARLNVPTGDAKPQQAEGQPNETKPAEPAANAKPVLPQLTGFEPDLANTPVPQAQPTLATDIDSLIAGQQRAAPLVTQAPVPVSGIAVEIAAQAKAGNNRFEIRLDPPELGRIDVRLDVDQDGNVKSRLVIERADTYDLLRKDASTLERALQHAGLKTSDNGLEFTLRDQGTAQREARDQNQRNTERGIIPDADVLPAEAASGYGRMLGLGGGVDIRI